MSKVKSITPLPPADFTPEMGNFKPLQPFRYWCQKVLPLVYDDSLSYYELLCKVVDYLNKVMEDVETLHGDVTNLHTAYEQLQNYVNTYFSSLDVQQEINNKLNKMAKDGTLSQLLQAIVGTDSFPTFVDSVSEMSNARKVYVLSSNGHIYYYSDSNWKDSGLIYGAFNSYSPSNIIITQSNIGTYFNDLNNAPLNKTVYLHNIPNTLMANLPVNNATASVSTFQYSNQDMQPGGYQLFVSNDEVYIRTNTGSVPNFTWHEWVKLNNDINYRPSNIMVTQSNIGEYFSDLNNAPVNKTVLLYNIPNTLMANLPVNNATASVSTFQYSDNPVQPGGYQLFVSNDEVYIRTNTGSAPNFTWYEWVKLSNDINYRPSNIIITQSNIGTYFNDLNNAPLNKTVFLYNIPNTLMANLPVNNATASVSTFQYSDNPVQPGGYQLFVSNDEVYIRTNTGSAPNFTWHEWVKLSNNDNLYYPNGFNLFRKFCTVGDSLSVGYHTLKNGSKISADLDVSWASYIKNKYNNEVYWSGKSGATCLSWLNEPSDTWGLKYTQKIGTMPLYVLCMGANEVGTTIGTENDIGTNNATLYAYVSRVIKELREISPDCFIISTGISRGQGITDGVIGVNTVYKTMEKHFKNYFYMDCINEFNSSPFTELYNDWHYTPTGYNAMSELYSKKFNDVIKENLTKFLYV